VIYKEVIISKRRKIMIINNDVIDKFAQIAKINPQIKISSKEIGVASSDKKAIVYWQWNQDVEKEYGIYDMNNFLNMVKLHNLDDIETVEKTDRIEIKSSNGINNYKFEAQNITSIFLSPPDKETFLSKLTDDPKEFKLSVRDIELLQKQSCVLGSEDMVFEGNTITLTNENDSSSNTYKKVLDSVEEISKSIIMTSMFALMRPLEFTVKIYETAVIFDSGEICYVHVKLK